MKVCVWPGVVLLTVSMGLGGQQPGRVLTDARLDADQQAQFAAAQADFQAQRWEQASAKLAALHTSVPTDDLLTKFLAEAEVNGGKPQEAVRVLGPVLATNQDDVQALAIDAHAYAQLQDGPERDAALAHLQRLHDSGAAKVQAIVLERTPTAKGGYVLFFHYLEPWSRYKVEEMARVFNSSGQQVWRVTLENADFDQPEFAKEHPELAEKGVRRFSMDGYSEATPTAQGGSTQTHATYESFDGKPTFEVFHEKVMSIAEGKANPIGSSSGVPVPAKPQ